MEGPCGMAGGVATCSSLGVLNLSAEAAVSLVDRIFYFFPHMELKTHIYCKIYFV